MKSFKVNLPGAIIISTLILCATLIFIHITGNKYTYAGEFLKFNQRTGTMEIIKTK